MKSHMFREQQKKRSCDEKGETVKQRNCETATRQHDKTAKEQQSEANKVQSDLTLKQALNVALLGKPHIFCEQLEKEMEVAMTTVKQKSGEMAKLRNGKN